MSSSLFLYGNLEYGQEYDLYTDRELIKKFNSGNDQAEKCMLKRYFYLIKRIISSFYIMGCGKDDLLQESMIGLVKAMKSYDDKFDVSFKTYAEICIRRQILTTLRKSKNYETLKKISLFNCFDEDWILEQLCDDSYNPEDILIYEEEKNNIMELAALYLSEYEKSVLKEFGSGKSYREIAEVLETDLKSVDNALQRVRKKIGRKKY
jgi:RNA polymerase sporulation-specific sigma factor